jgi:hypothetical protein
MDSKVSILIVLFFLPLLAFCQKSKKRIDSSELQLKLFASELFYKEQLNIVDSSVGKKSIDYFSSKYFQESNYSQAAIQEIIDYSTKQAHKDFSSDERGKCLCYPSSLLFFTSDKLGKKVKSLRKYLNIDY